MGGQPVQFTVPPGYYAPLAIITDADHGGWIIIATALGFVMALLSCAIRFYVKWVSTELAGMDDVLLVTAAMFAVAQQSTILAACGKGLGRSVSLLDPGSLRYVEQSFYASQLFAVLALGLCKCSIAGFIIRLTPQSFLRRTLYGYMACAAAWMVAAVLAHAFQCRLSSPWALATFQCPRLWTRVLLIGVFDAVLEAALLGCVVLLVFRLQVKRYKKLAVLLAFGLRLPIIAIIAARLRAFAHVDVGDLARTETMYIVWTVTQINFSLVSTTLPILRPFITDLTTFYGALRPSEYDDDDGGGGGGTGHHSRFNSSFPLSSTCRTKRSDASHGTDQGSSSTNGSDAFDLAHTVATRTEIQAHEAGPSGAHTRSCERDSFDTNRSQRRMIIRVDTQWAVSREE